MSDDAALTASIAAKWETDGLDAGHDNADIPREEEVAEVTEGDEPDPTATETSTATETTESPVDPNAEEVVPETTETTPETTPEKIAEQAEVQKEIEDDLAAALGLGKPPEDPKKRAQWWKTRVPYSQLHKVVTEREKKLGETHAGVLKERDTKIAEHDTRDKEVKTVEDFITNNAGEYIKRLAEIFPDTYGKMFAPILGDGGGAEKIPDITEDPGPKPEPDYELPNGGGKTYSVEGYQKLMDWQQKVTEQNMLKRFKPHLDFVQSQQKEAEKQAKVQAAEQQQKTSAEASKKAIAEVETWDYGKENFDAIIAEANKLDSRYNVETALNIAYRKIINTTVIPKLKADRDKMTAEIVAAQKKASAKQTAEGLSQSRTNPTTATTTGGSVDDRIKAKWKKDGLVP